MKTTKEIRKEIKTELGYNSRQISVREHSYSMGSTLYFTVRSSEVDIEKAKKFIERFSRINRCSYSGDILSGGNTYIRFSVTDEVKKEIGQPNEEIIEKLKDIAIQNRDKIQENYVFTHKGFTLCKNHRLPLDREVYVRKSVDGKITRLWGEFAAYELNNL